MTTRPPRLLQAGEGRSLHYRSTQFMIGEQNPQDIGELTVWLEADDAKSRVMRATRLRDLLHILPIPSDGLSFLGGEQSMLCFEEIRRCYLNGSNMAVVLLCLAYVERELVAQLYAAGWDRAKKAPLVEVLERAYNDRVLSDLEWHTYGELRHLRNSHAHFREPDAGARPDAGAHTQRTSFVVRAVKENALGTELLAKDARNALQAMARIVKRQSGQRVVLSPPGE